MQKKGSHLRDRAAGGEEIHTPSSGVEVRNEWSHSSIPVKDFMSFVGENSSLGSIWNINVLKRSSQYCVFIFI
jgi:hypothetical protein